MRNPGTGDQEQGTEIQAVEVGASKSQPSDAKFSAFQLVAFGAMAAAATSAIFFLAGGKSEEPPPVSGAEEECCGDSPAGFRNDALFPLDAGNPANLNKCKKSKAQLPDGGVRPLCANTDLVGSPTNPCVVTGLKASTCACYEGQAQACDPDGGGPCTSGTNCGIQACIVTSDTSSTWSPCTCM